jgi:predicted nucleic acid-binding Zn ribbon protein
VGFEKLKDILDRAQGRYPALAKRIKEAQALSRWEVAVGPAIARHARAFRVKDAVLWVEVDHPLWKSELHHRKRQILEKLNSGLEHRAGSEPEQPLQDILFLEPRPDRARG